MEEFENNVKFGIFESYSHYFGPHSIGCAFPVNKAEMVAITMKETILFEGDEIKARARYHFCTGCYIPEVTLIVAHTYRGSELFAMQINDLNNPILSNFPTDQVGVYHMIYSPKSHAILTIGTGVKVWNISWVDLGRKMFTTNSKVIITLRSTFALGYDSPMLNPPDFDYENERLYLPTAEGIRGFNLDGFPCDLITRLPADTSTIYAFCPHNKKVVTSDPVNGVIIWKKGAEMEKRITTLGPTILSLGFIDPQNILYLNAGGSLFLINVKASRPFHCYDSPQMPTRLSIIKLYGRPHITFCMRSTFRLLRVVIPWKVWNLNIARPKIITRSPKCHCAAQIITQTDNSFIKLYSPQTRRPLVSTTPGEATTPHTFFYDRGTFVEYKYDELSHGYLEQAVQTCPDEPRDYLFVAFDNGIIVNYDMSCVPCVELWSSKMNALCVEMIKVPSTSADAKNNDEPADETEAKEGEENVKSNDTWLYAVGRSDGGLSLLDYFTFKEVRTVSVCKEKIRGMLYHYHSNSIIFVLENKLQMLDLKTYQIIDTIWYHFTEVFAMHGDTIYMGGKEGEIERFEIIDRRFVQGKSEIEPKPHNERITSFAFGKKYYLSASIDSTFMLWNYDHDKISLVTVPFPIYSISFLGPRREILLGMDTEVMIMDPTILFGDEVDPEIELIDNYDRKDDLLDPELRAMKAIEEEAKKKQAINALFANTIAPETKRPRNFFKKALLRYQQEQALLQEKGQQLFEKGGSAELPGDNRNSQFGGGGANDLLGDTNKEKGKSTNQQKGQSSSNQKQEKEAENKDNSKPATNKVKRKKVKKDNDDKNKDDASKTNPENALDLLNQMGGNKDGKEAKKSSGKKPEVDISKMNFAESNKNQDNPHDKQKEGKQKGEENNEDDENEGEEKEKKKSKSKGKSSKQDQPKSSGGKKSKQKENEKAKENDKQKEKDKEQEKAKEKEKEKQKQKEAEKAKENEKQKQKQKEKDNANDKKNAAKQKESNDNSSPNKKADNSNKAQKKQPSSPSASSPSKEASSKQKDPSSSSSKPQQQQESNPAKSGSDSSKANPKKTDTAPATITSTNPANSGTNNSAANQPNSACSPSASKDNNKINSGAIKQPNTSTNPTASSNSGIANSNQPNSSAATANNKDNNNKNNNINQPNSTINNNQPNEANKANKTGGIDSSTNDKDKEKDKNNNNNKVSNDSTKKAPDASDKNNNNGDGDGDAGAGASAAGGVKEIVDNPPNPAVVDENGNVLMSLSINSEGKPVNDKGEVLDNIYVNQDGHFVNENGEYVNEKGEPIDAADKIKYVSIASQYDYVTEDGTPISGKAIEQEIQDSLQVAVEMDRANSDKSKEQIQDFHEAYDLKNPTDDMNADGNEHENENKESNENENENEDKNEHENANEKDGDGVCGGVGNEAGLNVGGDGGDVDVDGGGDSDSEKLVRVMGSKQQVERPSTPPPVRWHVINDQESDRNSQKFEPHNRRSRTPPLKRRRKRWQKEDDHLPPPNIVLDPEAVLSMFGRGHTELLPLIERIRRDYVSYQTHIAPLPIVVKQGKKFRVIRPTFDASGTKLNVKFLLFPDNNFNKESSNRPYSNFNTDSYDSYNYKNMRASMKTFKPKVYKVVSKPKKEIENNEQLKGNIPVISLNPVNSNSEVKESSNVHFVDDGVKSPRPPSDRSSFNYSPHRKFDVLNHAAHLAANQRGFQIKPLNIQREKEEEKEREKEKEEEVDFVSYKPKSARRKRSPYDEDEMKKNQFNFNFNEINESSLNKSYEEKDSENELNTSVSFNPVINTPRTRPATIKDYSYLLDSDAASSFSTPKNKMSASLREMFPMTTKGPVKDDTRSILKGLYKGGGYFVGGGGMTRKLPGDLSYSMKLTRPTVKKKNSPNQIRKSNGFNNYYKQPANEV